ncbi:hypothetical protein GCM10009727_86320 [Actinomadura napierensis]|uniref:Uncharacterized protein n=1 Tax=Actinomadura napierensis TaxID=267854 RepID=A0ABN3AG10_9ACTN
MALPRCGFQKGAPSATEPDGVRRVGNVVAVGSFKAVVLADRRTTGSTGPRGGVPVGSGPAAATEKKAPPRHGRHSNHTSAPQTS